MFLFVFCYCFVGEFERERREENRERKAGETGDIYLSKHSCFPFIFLETSVGKDASSSGNSESITQKLCAILWDFGTQTWDFPPATVLITADYVESLELVFSEVGFI